MSGSRNLIEEQVVAALTRKKFVLATVESCTGGLIASRITDIPGASAAFWGSWCAYDNSAKLFLGVDTAILREHGAVSPETASALALAGLGAMRAGLAAAPADQIRFGAPVAGHVCLATTGIAGPTGGTPEKPVGLCYASLAARGAGTRVRRILAPSELTRVELKGLFSEKALELLQEFLGEKT